MGGNSTKINSPEDNRGSVTINFTHLNVRMDRPRFDLNSGRCFVPSEPEMSFGFSHTQRPYRTWPSYWDIPGGSGKDVVGNPWT